MKRDRKFNNNKFSFKIRQKNLSKSTKIFKIIRQTPEFPSKNDEIGRMDNRNQAR